MAILLTRETRAIVQGITGKVGSIQTKWMVEYGTNIVAGVTPGKKGEKVYGVPVFDDVRETVEKFGANASVIFAPPAFAKDAVFEAIEAGIKLVVVVPEHVPVADAMEMREMAEKGKVYMLGPTTPGVITPGVGKLGIMPGNMFKPGKIGVISRSGTLSYEVSGYLNEAGFGESTVVGIGADPVTGMNMSELLELFDRDDDTEAVVIVGEIGGTKEEEACEFIRKMSKPVVAYIAGRLAPPGKRMGHAGAIIQGEAGSFKSKIERLEEAGAKIALKLFEVPHILKGLL
ncbi:MAG: succinate--CoA ligase subunit alpha [Synergistetes bacterium]|nr:succinate--CoA ligase subunit alpha [Synergistota bacterium]